MTSSVTGSLCLVLFLLPALLTAASPAFVWPAHDRAVHSVHSPVVNQQQQQQQQQEQEQHRHLRLSASASIQPAAVWAGVPVSIATFPVGGNSSSRMLVVAYPLPLHVLAVDPLTATVMNGSYSLPTGYRAQNLLATVSVVVLHLPADADSDAADSIHVLDARSLQLLHSYDLDYALEVLSINAAGDTVLTTVIGSGELVALHVMTGKRIASYDGGQSNLIVLGGALHPTTGAVYVWNGSIDTGYSLLTVAANNSLVSSFPLQLDLLTYSGSISLDLSAQHVFVLYITDVDVWQCVVQQYRLSTGQRTFILPLNPQRVRLTQFLSPAWTAGAALTVNGFADQILVLSQDGASPPFMVGGRPTLLFPSDVAVLPSAGRDKEPTVLLSTGFPRAVYELDQQGLLVYQYVTDDDANACFTQLVAADAAGRVYVPYCNGSVAVFDGRSRRLLHSFSIGLDNILAALVAGPHGTVYHITTAYSGIVQQHIVTGRIVANLSVTNALLKGLAYDPRNQTVWTTDLGLVTGSSSIYQLAADGEMLNNFSCSSAAAAALSATAAASAWCWDLAVDAAHDRLLVGYYDTSGVGLLLWLNPGNGSVVDSYKFPNQAAAVALAVSHDGSRLYAPDGRDTVYVFNQPPPEDEDAGAAVSRLGRLSP